MRFCRFPVVYSVLVSLGLLFALTVQAATPCCASKTLDANGKPVLKVEMGTQSSCLYDTLQVDTTDEICADASIQTYASLPEYKSFSDAVQKAINAGISGAAGVAEGVNEAGKAIDKAGSLLNHGAQFVPVSAQTLNPLGMTTSVQGLIGKMIKAVLGILGTIAFALFIYAGLLWMSSAGNSDRIEKAQSILVWASLGIVMIFSSYAIVSFVFEAFK